MVGGNTKELFTPGEGAELRHLPPNAHKPFKNLQDNMLRAESGSLEGSCSALLPRMDLEMPGVHLPQSFWVFFFFVFKGAPG